MQTTGELFNALALCGMVEDVRRREVLMRGVLGHLAARHPSPEVEADLAWEDVQALLVPRSTAPRPAFAPVRPAAKPGLWLYAAEQGTDLECGEFVEWSWPLGGRDQPVLGVVEKQEPLMIRVHRSFYESAGRRVPFFLRAYDGLLLLGVTEKRARVLVQRTDSTVLMGVAIYTYRRRAEVRNPPAYVETLIRSLEPDAAPRPPRDQLQSGESQP